MECSTITKYTIIEAYPAILKHKIPLISIFLFFIYLINIFIEIITKFFKSSNKLNFFPGLFKKEKEAFVVEGSTKMKDFGVDTQNILKLRESELNRLKKSVKTTKVEYFYKKKAKEKLRTLYQEGLCQLADIVELGYFILKKEDIQYLSIQSVENNTILTKGYSEASVKTASFYLKIANKTKELFSFSDKKNHKKNEK